MTTPMRMARPVVAGVLAILASSVWPAAVWAQASMTLQASPPPATLSPIGPSKAPPPELAGKTISFEEAVTIALQAQPQIQARLYDYAAARFRVDQAFAPLLPQLTGTLSSQWSSSTVLSTTGTGATVPVTVSRSFEDTFLGQVSLSQLLFDFGKTAASVDAARKLAEVSRYDIELQRQLITQSVKEAYTNVNFAQRLILVQRQALERAELNFKSAKGFFEVGTRPKSDVARAAVDVANAKVDLIRAVNAERTAKVALNTAMGYQADRPLRVQDNLVYTPSQVDTLPKLMDEALRQQPEYRQAKLSVEASDAKQRQTFRDFFPDLTGAGTYGGARTDLNEQWSATLSLTWSIYDGGNRIAKYQEAKALTEAARANVKATELNISKDVESAQIAVQETSERIQAAQTAVESAQENFRLAQGRFDAGVGTILDLTDAQSALNQALNGEALALADYRIALARLDRAVGRR